MRWLKYLVSVAFISVLLGGTGCARFFPSDPAPGSLGLRRSDGGYDVLFSPCGGRAAVRSVHVGAEHAQGFETAERAPIAVRREGDVLVLSLPLAGLRRIRDRVFVSLATEPDRIWENTFDLRFVGSEINGGAAFEDNDMTAEVLARHCPE